MADFQYSYLFLFLIIYLISNIFIRKLFKTIGVIKSHHHHLPPSPFALPIIGHLHLIARPNPLHQVFYNLSLRYGPIFHVFLGSIPCVVASSPEAAKMFLKTYETVFLDRPQTSVVLYLTYGSKDFSFSPYGPYWKFMKKMVISKLLNGATQDLLLPVRQDEINRFIKSLFQKAKDGVAVDLNGELLRVSNNMISRILMSERCSEKDGEAGEIRKLVFDILQVMGNFNLSDNIWLFKNLDLQGFKKRVKDIHTRYDVLMERIIKEHEDARKQGTGSERKDLLNILLDIAEDQSMEINLSRDHIKAFILNVFAAGTDNTASTMEWALAELINHPKIMKKAIKEIDQVVGKTRLLQESDLPNLPYLQAIVKETLRLHPSIALIPRKSSEDLIVAGYHIPKNTNVFVNVWALGRDPKSWNNPLEFMPERFEETQLDLRGQHFQLLPFGSGRRMCPATSLSLHMVQTMLGTMIQCFKWYPGKCGNLTSVDMDEGHGLTVPRANNLVCVPLARLDPVQMSI